MMDLLDDATETVSILREGASDWAGDSSGFDFSHKIFGVLFEHASMTTSRGDGREDSRVDGKVMMPLGSDVKATDRIERENGSIVRVIGRPMPYKLGLVQGVAFLYREVSGSGLG